MYTPAESAPTRLPAVVTGGVGRKSVGPVPTGQSQLLCNTASPAPRCAWPKRPDAVHCIQKQPWTTGLAAAALSDSTSKTSCSPAPGLVFDSGAVRRSPQRVPKRLDTSLSSTTGCEESGGPARVCALAPGCVGCCLAAWCGGFAPGVHTTGARGASPVTPQRRFRAATSHHARGRRIRVDGSMPSLCCCIAG